MPEKSSRVLRPERSCLQHTPYRVRSLQLDRSKTTSLSYRHGSQARSPAADSSTAAPTLRWLMLRAAVCAPFSMRTERAFARNLKTVAIKPWNFASGWARADDRHGQARGPPGRHNLSQLRLPVCRRRPSTPVRQCQWPAGVAAAAPPGIAARPRARQPGLERGARG